MKTLNKRFEPRAENLFSIYLYDNFYALLTPGGSVMPFEIRSALMEEVGIKQWVHEALYNEL